MAEYQTVKARAPVLVERMYKGKDPYQQLMADRDDPWHPHFLLRLPIILPEENDRQILLDRLVREYAGLDGWMALCRSRMPRG